MDQEKQVEYEVKLQSLLVEMETQIAGTRDERAPVEVDGRMGRVSRGDAMQAQQMAIEMARRRELRITQIRAALDRVRSGRYGLCGRCRRPIDEARLEAVPEVVLCVRCAETPRRP